MNNGIPRENIIAAIEARLRDYRHRALVDEEWGDFVAFYIEGFEEMDFLPYFYASREDIHFEGIEHYLILEENSSSSSESESESESANRN